MTRWRALLTGAIFLLLSLVLAVSGFIHLQNGLAVNAAFPVPLDISTNTPLPRIAYIDAAVVLRHANTHDGNTQLSFAQARFHAGEKSGRILNQVEGGLTGAPASAEGWAFYAEALASSDPEKASEALDQAFTLAPYDFFWAGQRVLLASHIWNYLGSDTKNEALQQTRMLWNEPTLRNDLLPLLAMSDGRNLLTHAYANDPATLRAINRWISAMRRQLQPVKS